MVHWLWTLLAFIIGANVGMGIMAICACAKDAPPSAQPRDPQK